MKKWELEIEGIMGVTSFHGASLCSLLCTCQYSAQDVQG